MLKALGPFTFAFWIKGLLAFSICRPFPAFLSSNGFFYFLIFFFSPFFFLFFRMHIIFFFLL
ncbi:uncharacterized protein DS421_17g590590 [Arachis hypogaea]|nr:uncharacterized protein DS421_17g590590 [Arachis hypogaea]